MEKLTLRRTAEKFGIALSTAFIWRHKVLDSLQNMQNEVSLDGIVELDETYFSDSYKGNHKKSDFKIPRKKRKRGSYGVKAGLGKDKVCIPVMVNQERKSVARATNLGAPKKVDIINAVKENVSNGALLVTENNKTFRKITEKLDVSHVRIQSGKHRNGIYNIQLVNSHHSMLSDFINHKLNGVSSKYINNYCVYNNFVNFAVGNFTDKLNTLKNFVFSVNFKERSKDVSKRSNMPFTINDSNTEC